MPRACRSVNAVKSPFATDGRAVNVFPVDPNSETSSPKADGAMQRPAQGAGRKDWRTALGMFSGDALMKEIDEVEVEQRPFYVTKDGRGAPRHELLG